MPHVEDFLTQYAKEYDFYDQVARTAARELEAQIQSAGIRAIVTWRAKSPTRLEDKLVNRAQHKAYSSIDEIYSDIVDLAGVRVALYFPGELPKVEGIIGRVFEEWRPTKRFPGDDEVPSGRFAGYSASHFRVRMKRQNLAESEARLAEANIEIQVASVLMHAWAEVNHDLVYKPFQGKLSPTEYQLLELLNGLVASGEIALEGLQAAGETRIAAGDRPFANHFELAAHLIAAEDRAASAAVINEQGVGRVDVLFRFLRRIDRATPNRIRGAIEKLHGDVESRPLADQIVDSLLGELPGAYGTYLDVRKSFGLGDTEPIDLSRAERERVALNDFVGRWVHLENVLRGRLSSRGAQVPTPTTHALVKTGTLSPTLSAEFDDVRKLRNAIVHGGFRPSDGELAASLESIDRLISAVS